NYYFFFQAEDGIRDDLVTGVQTCALPIFGEVPKYPPQLVMSARPRYRPTIRIQSSRTPFVVLIRRKSRITFSDLQKPCASAFGTHSSPTNSSLIYNLRFDSAACQK